MHSPEVRDQAAQRCALQNKMMEVDSTLSADPEAPFAPRLL